MSEDVSNSIALLVNPVSGEEFNICRYSTSIGRELANDLVIASDKTISRQHAIVQVINGKFYVQDLGSKNGTRLNGEQISGMVPLSSADEVSFGLTRLIFLLLPSNNSNGWSRPVITETLDPVVPRPLVTK